MTRPLNFLHLTTYYPPYHFGGDGMYIYRLCHALGEAGHHVDVIHDVDAYSLAHPAPPLIQFPNHPNVTVHGLRSRFGALSPLLAQQTGYPLLKQKVIREVLDSKPYDVIQFHNISLLGPQVLKMDSRNRAVKLYMMHEHWLVCPMHVLWKFNSRVCDKPECLRCTMLGKRPPQIWRYTGMLAHVSRCVDSFVSPSLFTARIHAERGFSQPVGHLPCFVERVDRDWQEPAPRPQDKLYFLFVGRLEKLKGLHTLIALWNKGVDFDLLIAGTGTYEPELRALAASNPRIKFLGALPQRELGALYFHSIACIVPSIAYETFGLIIVEAFARKAPVIVRDLGALPEVVHDSGGGLVYHTDEELLTAMNRIAGAPALRAELGEKGYRAFLRWWSKEAHLELYFDLLRQIAVKKFTYVPWEQDELGVVPSREFTTPPSSIES